MARPHAPPLLGLRLKPMPLEWARRAAGRWQASAFWLALRHGCLSFWTVPFAAQGELRLLIDMPGGLHVPGMGSAEQQGWCVGLHMNSAAQQELCVGLI